MAYTEVTHEGWFSRILESIKGVLFGILLFLIAFPVLFWNEGRAVHRAKGLAAGKGQVVSVSAERVDSTHEGKLVHLSGQAITSEVVADPEFGVKAPEALRLRRVVEMYQWKEREEKRSKKKVGGGKTTTREYTYEQVWSDELLDSSSYKEPGHQNPQSKGYESQAWNASKAKLGAFSLGDLTAKLDDWKPVTVEKSVKADLKLADGGLYRGASPTTPAVGDLRIRLEKVPSGPVSVLAVQSGSGFARFDSGQGDSGLFEAVHGSQTPEQMFGSLEAQNSVATWVLRAIGFFMIAIGLFCILNPLVVVADVIPFFGGLVGAGALFAALALALPLTLVTIAVGWIVYRPLLGLGLLAIAAGLIWAAARKSKSRD